MGDSIGKILQKARLRADKSLEDASLATRIRLEYLSALENDQRDFLPSEVQARGFLRLYADFLGLPIDPLLAKWAGLEISEDFFSEPEPQPILQQEENPPEEISLEQSVTFSPEPPPQTDTFSTPTIVDSSISESQRIYYEIGSTLKKQREALGLSLNDVEGYIHIRPHYLEAIENGRMDHLPSSVQGRGMLNNYAKFLQLDPDEIMLRFADGLQSHRIEYLEKHQSPSIRSKSGKTKPGKTTYRRLLTQDLIVGGFLIILLFGITVWSLSQVLKPAQNAYQSTAPSISEILLSTQSPTAATGEPGLKTTENSVPSEQALAQPEQNETNESPSEINLPATSSGDIPFNIQLIANQRAWVRVIADNKEIFNKRVNPGNVYQFSASKQLQLTSGNAAALQLIYNQQNLGVLGIVGQVVNMTFSEDGIQTPTAIPTMTPLPTQEFTPSVAGPTPTQATPSPTPFIP